MASRRGRVRDTSALQLWGAPDQFGVPTNFLGYHPEEVYGAVGRVVTLSALLEDRQRVLLQGLTRVRPEVYADLAAGGVVATLRHVAKTLPGDEPLRADLLSVLKGTSRAYGLRNTVVYSLWPAQADGRLFGHRRLPETGEIQMAEWSMDTLYGLVADLVRLIQSTEACLMRMPTHPSVAQADPELLVALSVPAAPTFDGSEPFDGLPGVTLAEFWRWGMSDLRTNTLRGVLAEFLVARAVGSLQAHRVEWDPYDVVTPEGITVEVKSAAYLQAWAQKRLSRVEFSGLSARRLDEEMGNYPGDRDYNADVYVFAVQTAKDHAVLNTLDVHQWEFYVTDRASVAATHRRSLGLNAVRALAGSPVPWSDLHAAIVRIHRQRAESTED